jgi:hypothetical protein
VQRRTEIAGELDGDRKLSSRLIGDFAADGDGADVCGHDALLLADGCNRHRTWRVA